MTQPLIGKRENAIAGNVETNSGHFERVTEPLHLEEDVVLDDVGPDGRCQELDEGVLADEGLEVDLGNVEVAEHPENLDEDVRGDVGTEDADEVRDVRHEAALDGRAVLADVSDHLREPPPVGW